MAELKMAITKQRTFPDIRADAVHRARRATKFVHARATAEGIGSRALTADRPGLEWLRATANAFDLIGVPAAVLSRSHQLAAANKLMEKLIPHLVQDRPSRITLADRRADAMLGQSLTQLQSSTGGQALSIPIAATSGLPASLVHVMPLDGAANELFADASCVLVITAVARPEIASAQVIQGLFDLTPAEARVAQGIAAGRTVDELANDAGLAVGTVRQQLKSVFSKTGVSRQADLVGLLLGSAPSFPGKTSSAGLAWA